MTQPDLFSGRPVVPASPTLPPSTRRRLSRQNAAILARLERGPATNDELSRIARKYTGRLSELRKAGYNVRPVEQNHATGLVVYRLVPDAA